MLNVKIEFNNKEVDWPFKEIHITDTIKKQADQMDLIVDTTSLDFSKFKKGDSVRITAGYENTSLFLGEYLIDRIIYNEKNKTIEIGGISALFSQKSKWKEKKYIKYKNTTLKTIVSGIAQRNGYPLIWGGADFAIDEIKQRTSDAKFLRILADEAGYYLKFFKKRVIFQTLNLEEKKIVRNGKEIKAIEGSGDRYIDITGEDTQDGFSYTWQAPSEDKKEKIEYKPFENKFNKLILQSQENKGINVGVEIALDNVLPIEKNIEAAAIQAGLDEFELNFSMDATNKKISMISGGSIVYISGSWLVENCIHSINNIDGWRCDYVLRRLSGEEVPKPSVAKKRKRRKAVAKKRKSLLSIPVGEKTTLDYLDYAEGKIPLVSID